MKYYSFLFLFFFLSNVIYSEDYTVIKKDTLSKIAEKKLGNKTRWKEIADLNEIKPPYHIQLNQILKLPMRKTPDNKEPKIKIKNETKDSNNHSKKKTGFDKDFITWLLAGFVISLIMSTISLRIGCWFSLVETNIISCALISLVMSLMTIISISTMTLLIFLKITTELPLIAFIATGILLATMYCIFSVLTAKKILKCYWRSLITILIMTTTIGEITTLMILWLLAVILPNLLPIDTIQNLWQQIPF